MSGFAIRRAEGAADLADAATLFRAYADSLPIPLDYQGFGDELAGLPGQYGAPDGLLLIAHSDAGDAIGCVGVRPRGVGVVEMKRLYVTDAARGTGLGLALIRAAIDWAVERGCGTIRLDTLEGMTRAIALYERLGFRRTEAYYAPTPPGTVFMALDLPPLAIRPGAA